MYNPSICLSLKDLRPSLWLCFYSEVGFFQPGNYFYPALFLLHPSRVHPLPVGPFSFFLPVLSQISRKVIPFYAPYDPRWTTIRLQIIEYFDCQANKSREGGNASLWRYVNLYSVVSRFAYIKAFTKRICLSLCTPCESIS